ncbi:hypothetical protein [Vreelandella sp. EE7]
MKVDSNLLELVLDKIFSSGVHGFGSDDALKILTDYKDSEYILISFSGAVTDRANKSPPFFSFENLAKQLGVSLIAFSDPTVDRDINCSLAWYIGNDEFPGLHFLIAKICDSIIERTGKKLILTGGSGGGFAALSIHQLMHDKDNSTAFVWNPQSDIINYSLGHVGRFLNQAYTTVNEKWGRDKERLVNFLKEKEIRYKFLRENEKRTVIYMDGYDSPHLRLHLKEYLHGEGIDKKINNGLLFNNIFIFFGSWGVGHTPPRKELILQALENIINNKPLDAFDILYDEASNRIPLLDLKAHKVTLSESMKVYFKLVENMLYCHINLASMFVGYSLSLHFFLNEDGIEKKIGNSGFVSKTVSEDFFIRIENFDAEKIKNMYIRVHVFDFFDSKFSIKIPLLGRVEKASLININLN